MVNKLVRLLLTAVAALAGYHTVFLLHQTLSMGESPIIWQYLVLGPLVGALLGWLLAPLLIRAFRRGVDYIVSMVQRVPTADVIAGCCGLIVGLLIGTLATFYLPKELPFVGAFIPFVISLTTGYIGAAVAVRKREEFIGYFARSRWQRSSDGAGGEASRPKVLDTSVIIDGRILDVCRAGFIEGSLIVPTFVLEELQHIADSADPLRRNRGRRGLDILAQIQQLPGIDVKVLNVNPDEPGEVDTKLIRVAQKYEAKILTNDYNLNKVAGLQGVEVLNINELANAVKPVVLPGEEMGVQIIKEGKELGQGVGYLDDGTMIVVDNGKRYIGRTVTVVVTSVLQTAAGRMIFGKPRDVEEVAGLSR